MTVSSHRRLRPMGAPFVAAVPTGRRVRTGLVVCESDTVVLLALGGHLGRLAGAEQARRSRHARGAWVSRRERKRALTQKLPS